jgi:hypothetical protein
MMSRPDYIEEYHRGCAELAKVGRVIDGHGSTVRSHRGPIHSMYAEKRSI